MSKVITVLFVISFVMGVRALTTTSTAETCPMINLKEMFTYRTSTSRRQKRTITLPNASSLTVQSRLRIPQGSLGFYVIWVKVNFFIRPLFNEATSNSTGINTNFLGRKKRSVDDNILVRSLAEDQASILGRLEESLSRSGINGRQCVLRTICELKETPIHEWSLIGEMISVLFRPKDDNDTKLLEEYKAAESRGEKHGDCWSFYPSCPFSIFNIIPDLYTSDDEVSLDFEGGMESDEDHITEEEVMVHD